MSAGSGGSPPDWHDPRAGAVASMHGKLAPIRTLVRVSRWTGAPRPAIVPAWLGGGWAARRWLS